MMKEACIIHFKPRDISEAAGFDLLERLIASEQPVTNREIKKYVDGVVAELKKLKSPPEKKHFLKRLTKSLWGNQPEKKEDKKITAVVGGLEDETAIDKYQLRHVSSSIKPDEKAELSTGMNKIRSAIAEELKQRLTKEVELHHLNYSDVNFLVSWLDILRATQERRVGRVKDLHQRVSVFKKTPEKELFDKSELKIHNAALEKFSKLEPHDNVIKFRELDLSGGKSIAEELKLKTVKELLDEGNASDLKILKAIKDCLAGAIWLEKNGLVLQDISLHNLGLVEKNGQERGILFDLDGLCLAGAEMESRIGKRPYMPPEAGIVAGLTPVNSAEMVYQFGICLKEAANAMEDLPRNAWNNLEKLSTSMISFEEKLRNPMQNRISLEEAKNKLDALIAEVAKLDQKTV